MLIKFGKEKHLFSLMNFGEMYFNPCEYFRNLEEKQKKRGIGDGNDGGLITPFTNARAVGENGKTVTLEDGSISVIMQPAAKTPVFCLRRVETKYISSEYREKLHEQFPEHTHALIIREESEFLENVRYHFKSKAFAHPIYYQDKLYIEFYQFLKDGKSEIRFYEPRSRNRYYMEIHMQPIDGGTKKESLVIDDSNFYKTMYRKSTFFSDQMEYRIVLPYERIENGEVRRISPFNAELVSIDDLVR